jgi:hypothetical protein
VLSFSEILTQAGINARIEEDSSWVIITFSIHAKPGAKKERIEIGENGEMIIAISSRAVDGEANKALLAALSKALGVSKSQLEIVSGDHGRKKRVKVSIQFTDHKRDSYYKEKLIDLIGVK